MKRRLPYILPKDTELTGKVVAQAIEDNKSNIGYFAQLESYIDDEPVMSRTSPNELLAIHNFAGYITSINTSYLVGNPVDYKASDNTNLDKLMETYEAQSIEELDADIAADMSMFGQAFECDYVNEDTQVRSAKLSVYNTIVIYDDTFMHNKQAAIYYSAIRDANGHVKPGEYDVTIWTPTHIMHRYLRNNVMTEDPDRPDAEHFFGAVPVIHWWNNRRLKGDYEPVITLIDAYNILQSDRVLDREKLVDAILAFYGTTVKSEDMESIKEHRTIALPGEGAKAEYLIKNLDEADADVLRRTLAADIHKFSMTPDLTDESFGNSPSGVSILYKLLAFEQNIKKKERMMAMGLRERLKLYLNVMKYNSNIGTVDPKDVSIVFRRELPKNDFETSQMINNLEGTVDQETLVGRLSFVDDASKVVEKAREERQTSLAGNFGTDQED